jgi:hypothetical protein
MTDEASDEASDEKPATTAHLTRPQAEYKPSTLGKPDRRRWREAKRQVLAALRDLRDEQEGGFLRSPDLSTATLFASPALDEVPASPRGRRPAWDDDSRAAQEWRAQEDRREMLLRWRADAARAHRLRPGNVWREHSSAVERGGKRPGEHAYPPSWDAYLLRRDPDGPGGDGWMSPLGVAWIRLERTHTPMARAVWVYTDPRRVGGGADLIAQIAAALGIGQRQAYRWLDAGGAYLIKEIAVFQRGGTRRAQSEIAAAEQSEAEAWQHQHNVPGEYR